MIKDILNNNINGLHNDLMIKIIKFIAVPTNDNWDNIAHHILYPKNSRTIWQAMIVFDPSFPRICGRKILRGIVKNEWERIPTEIELLSAIKLATL